MARYLIIGGVAGGATAAARLRRLDEKAEIIIFERGGHVSYANCGLPYYLGGIIPDRRKLFLQTPMGFKMRLNIDVRTNTEIVRINRAEKIVEARNLATGASSRERYDKLLLSPGAEPVKPPIPGIDEEGIFTLRSVADSDRIRRHLTEKKPAAAVVVGGGFIGLEMAENLKRLGIDVTVVEMTNQVMANLDYEMAAAVHSHLLDKGVALLLNDGVASFVKKNDTIAVRLASGRELAAGIVILSIGVRPDASLAKNAGLAIGERGGISVNEYLQTSDPDIYAVGDAIEFAHPVTNQATITYLAGPANKQGRIAADNIVSGNTRTYSGTPATSVVRVFDLTVASTGASEKMLGARGIPFHASITHTDSHAAYYPGSALISMKILFAPDTGLLLGAQITGYDGVDKRIDVLSAILGRKGTIHDLLEFDQAYAPPYSSAKDPVNIAGFVADNILSGLVKNIHWHEISGLDPAKTIVLDVRTAGEHRDGAIEGSVNIPVDELRDNLPSIPRDKRVVIYCAVGQRGYVASRILEQNGYTDVYNLSGGYTTYSLARQKFPGRNP
ncbi:MAG: CoA-disulfide reductase [Spirochaetes bacterium RBG_13_51_14]|nr:MAG: CoA-disulfide reductase [Spirochaetes bacterium RBG_13_51_14]